MMRGVELPAGADRRAEIHLAPWVMLCTAGTYSFNAALALMW